MSSGKRVFIGRPCQKYIESSVDDFLLDRILDPDTWGKHRFKARNNPTSGHLDMARSVLIRQGLDWHADYIGQMDADVVVETETPIWMSYVAQDFANGAGLVFSPTTSIDWKAQFHPMVGHSQSEATQNAPFECDSGAGGFMVMTSEVARKLKVLGTGQYAYGGEENAPGTEPLYCVNRPALPTGEEGVSEDVSLMRNVRESTGLKVVCDPRILTGHLQPIYRPSWRPIDKVRPGALQMMFPPPLYRVLVESGHIPRPT